jgi:hypothetical protein
MPSDFKLIEARQPPLKDQYEEWLARVICYAFSVPATPFVAQVNRATSETMRLQATQEGLVPLKTWIKNALDQVIQVCMGEPNLEFVWVGDDAVDPLQQAQTLQILVSAGIKTREEARAELGLGGDKTAAGLGKYNQNHDERGWFSTADNAVGVLGHPARKPRLQGVQVASNDAVMSDGSAVAQTIGPEPPPEPPPAPEPPEPPRPAGTAGDVAEAVAPNGELQGTYVPGVDGRTMPASDDPASEAQAYVDRVAKGLTYALIPSKLDALGARVIRLSDGTFITYRPPGVSSKDTLPTTATVEINNPVLNRLNGGRRLKLKFPKK